MVTASLLDTFLKRTEDKIGAKAVTFYADGDGRGVELTYGQLAAQAGAFATLLQARELSGSRAVIALHSGPEFVVSFLGCLLAGVVATPLPPLRVGDAGALERLNAIAEDAGAAVVIASHSLCEAMQRHEFSHLPVSRLPWISPPPSGAAPPIVLFRSTRLVDAAFIQYTSGSTSKPKGVAVSHANLEANLDVIGKKLRVGRESVVVSWLPLHHDWGLVGVLLAGLYHGNHIVLINPLHFAQKPVRWLQAISRYRGTHTGAPNFAYDLCVRRVVEAEHEGLDLTSLEVAGCGAEPIRPQTVEAFCRRFASAGFRSTSFYPCYGLAEATLFVSGSDMPRDPVVMTVEQRNLGNGQTAIVESPEGKPVVSCGSVAAEHEVLIVDPEHRTVLAEDRLGEVWVRGPSIATAYWSRDGGPVSSPMAATADGRSSYLRTGDLGYIHDQELYLVGRLKDVIIVNGRKVHAHDLEDTVAKLLPAASRGQIAAFSYGDFSDERFAIAVEIHGCVKERLEELSYQMFSAIVRAHEVTPGRVVIVRPGALPLTTSGKMRRAHARAMLQNNAFDIQAEYVAK